MHCFCTMLWRVKRLAFFAAAYCWPSCHEALCHVSSRLCADRSKLAIVEEAEMACEESLGDFVYKCHLMQCLFGMI